MVAEPRPYGEGVQGGRWERTWHRFGGASGVEAPMTGLSQSRRGDDERGFSAVIESGHWAHWMRYNVNGTVMCY